MENQMEINIKAAVKGNYDVIVCGAGTAGCIAAIAAVRNGARTLLIEKRGLPGGMVTVGNAGITMSVVHTHDVKRYKKQVIDRLAFDPKSVQIIGGVTKEYIDRLLETNAGIGTFGQAGSYVFTSLYPAVWTTMDMLDEAKVEVLYLTDVCDVICKENKVEGVIVHNKSGFEAYTARIIVDSTGDGDVAALCGADYVLGAGKEDLEDFSNCKLGAMQGFGCMYRVDGVDFDKLISYLAQNPEKFKIQEFGLMDLDNIRESVQKGEMAVFRFRFGDNDKGLMQFYNTPIPNQCIFLTGIWEENTNGLNSGYVSKCIHRIHTKIRNEIESLKKTPGLENIVVNHIPDIGIRETRHIIGDYQLTGRDIFNNKSWDDSIGRGAHPVDIGGAAIGADGNDTGDNWSFGIPYRCLLAKNIEGLLISGRHISLSRLASGSVRPTVQCMVVGEAAGTAAALACKNNITPRNLDVSQLHDELKKQGVIF